MAVRACCQYVEAVIAVPAAETAMHGGDLPAMLACVGIGRGEDALAQSSKACSQSAEQNSVDLAGIVAGGTVGHSHHIPMVLTG